MKRCITRYRCDEPQNGFVHQSVYSHEDIADVKVGNSCVFATTGDGMKPILFNYECDSSIRWQYRCESERCHRVI